LTQSYQKQQSLMPTDRSSAATGPPNEKGSIKRPRWRLLALAGVIGLVVLAILGVGAFALSGGFDKTTSERVSGTETQVVRVALVDAAVGFDVTPDVLEVARGTHVVLNVVNEGGEDHDLAVEGGAMTRTLGPGQSQRLDLGTVVGDRAAWCTLPNHKVAGMTLDIEVVEPSAAKRGERAAGQPAYQTE
jgi:nitrite reductase (NO-forming)